MTEEKPYSVDENLVGRAIECGVMEDPWVAPPDGVYAITRDVADAPRAGRVSSCRLRAGRAGRARRRPDAAARARHELNSIVGAYGFGRLDMVENRRVGIKSRETYECPGALALDRSRTRTSSRSRSSAT